MSPQDEFGYSKYMYHYPASDDGWDGVSVELTADGHIRRKLAAIPLITLNATLQLVNHIQRRGGVLTANAAPLTRTYMRAVLNGLSADQLHFREDPVNAFVRNKTETSSPTNGSRVRSSAHTFAAVRCATITCGRPWG